MSIDLKEDEKLVLGSVLLDEKHFPSVAAQLSVADFQLDSHRQIFSAMKRLHAKAKAIDIGTVFNELGLTASSVGGPVYLAWLTEGLPRRPAIEDYIGIVKDSARRKNFAELGEALARDAGEPNADLNELLSRTQERLLEIGIESQATVPAFSVDAMLEAIKNTPKGLLTGWSSLDAAGIRFRPKELTIIAGRTGHGKSTALINILAHQLCRAPDFKGKLIFFSHEEPAELVVCRLIALATRMFDGPEQGWWSFDNVRRNYSGDHVSGLSVTALTSAVNWLRDLETRIEIIWKPNWTSQDICRYVRTAGNAAMVFVDYLQRVPAPENARKSDRRDMDISATARDLKTLAIEQSVPVLVAAQIGRQAVKDSVKESVSKSKDDAEAIEHLRGMRPELHQLREGGSEQEADMVLALMNYSADMTNEADKQRKPGSRRFDIGVLKQRYGPPGSWFSMLHEGLYGRISDGDGQ